MEPFVSLDFETANEHRGLSDVFFEYFPDEFFNHHEAEADAWACGKIFAQMQFELGIDRLAELCRPTGPGAVKEKSIRRIGKAKYLRKSVKEKQPQKEREWIYTRKATSEFSELLDRFKNTASLRGHHVTFTGTLDIAPRSTLQRLVTELGGVAEKSTTKRTTILVVGIQNPAAWAKGATGSRKLEKATKLREAGSPITVMSEADFLNFLHDGQE